MSQSRSDSLMSAPVSLYTTTLAEGQALAHTLATELCAASPAPQTMADQLKTNTAARPAPEIVAAIYFHAIALVNRGWQRPG